MDDLRAAVATALALVPASRLIVIDVPELVDAAALPVYAEVGAVAGETPRAVVADPLRLPFVAAIADLVLVKTDLVSEPQARLREVWRILAPAGALVLIVPLPTSLSLKSLIRRAFIHRRVARALAAAMFEVVSLKTVAGHLVVRAGKRDGLAPPRRSTVAVQAPATA